MRDALSHPGWHAPTSAFARVLASRLGLRPVELPWPGYTVDAALAVAPAGLKAHRTPTLPVVVLNRRAADGRLPSGASIVCGVQDEDDAACAAIAGALAHALGLHLIVVHAPACGAPVTRALAALAGMAVPAAGGVLRDAGAGREIVDRVTTAAGLGRLRSAQTRLVCGAPGPTIVATGRRERAALVVVGASSRGRVRTALQGSTTGYVIRRSARPVVVCPADPVAAMRLREVLTPTSDRRWTRP